MINNVIDKLNIKDDVYLYGKDKAKMSLDVLKKDDYKDNKVVLVTAINPTPMGEGKTTVSISLSDALNKLGKNSVLSLREPSLGPVFGLKGGATGGGKALVIPSDDINLHFTGDFHAITTANNLLASAIDNHIYFGNTLGIDRVTFRRCMDINDRQLRNINTGLSNLKNMKSREDSFDITAASEIMAILCLSKDIDDLKRRLGNIVIGYDKDNNIIRASSLNVVGAMTVLLKDAIMPNLVTTLEGNPAIIHGGPFANIAHGCSSIIATRTAMKLGEYVITEAGFGADLGAEKYLDIKTRLINKKPSCVVLVATIRSLKYHGGMDIKSIKDLSTEYLEKGISNLKKHYDNLKNVFGLNVVVAINKFDSDKEEEIEYLSKYLEDNNISYALTTGFSDGSDGSLELARKVIEEVSKENNFNYVYEVEDSIKTKIEKVATKIYGANGVNYSKEALETIKTLEDSKLDKYPICIAKTPYSLSDDDKNLCSSGSFNINVKDVVLKGGSEFILVLTGDVMLMPGLSRKPNYENIDLIDNKIKGVF